MNLAEENGLFTEHMRRFVLLIRLNQIKTEPPKTKPESNLDRAIRAERKLDAMKYRQHNEIYHRDSIIENYKNRIAELEASLAMANAQIKELEDITATQSSS